jgi:hypothetical protein
MIERDEQIPNCFVNKELQKYGESNGEKKNRISSRCGIKRAILELASRNYSFNKELYQGL